MSYVHIPVTLTHFQPPLFNIARKLQSDGTEADNTTIALELDF